MRNFKEITQYIEKEIIPIYYKNDAAHGYSHVQYVIKRAIKFAQQLHCDLSIIYVAAAFHDIGHYIDSSKHEKISAQIFSENEQMKKFFCAEERKIIFEAIEDHRASNNISPRSIYGEILSTADRTVSVKKAILRSIQYNIDKNKGLIEKNEIANNVKVYLNKKYGKNGYAKVFVYDRRFNSFVKRMTFLTRHNVLLEKIIMRGVDYVTKRHKGNNGTKM